MYYSDDLIEEIRMRNDIVDLISGYVKLKKKGSSYFGLCPFHNEKSPSFSVSPGKQMYHCFGCGEGGNVYTFLMRYENDTFLEAVKLLADRAGITLPETEYSAEEKRNNDLKSKILEVNKEAAKFFVYQLRSEQGKEGYAYFRGRGLTDETIVQFGLGYALKYSDSLYRYLKGKGYADEIIKETGLVKYSEKGVYDAFWNRVMYPIMDNNSRVIGFGGRVLGEGKPKYINSQETKVFDKSRNLYGLNFARLGGKTDLIICEGYMDVIALHQAGFRNAVAALGTAFTSGHAMLMKRYTNQVLMAFDSDGAGVKAALRAIPILRNAGLSVKIVNMKPYKDPDEFIKNLGTEEFRKRTEEAENAFLYEIRMLQQQYQMKDPDSRTKFYNEVALKLLGFQDEVERRIYLESVCEQFLIPKESMEKLLYKKGLTYTGEKEQPEIEKPKEKAKAEDGMKMSQKLLLTWLVEEENLYEKIKEIITEQDFVDPFYHKVAKLLFEQLREGKVNPAKILDRFDSEEEHRKAAELFHARLSGELSEAEREKALNETVHRVKKNSLDYAGKHAVDAETLQYIIKEQAKLQNIYISLDS